MNVIKELFSKHGSSAPMGFGVASGHNRRPILFNTGEGLSDAVCVLHGQNIDKVEAQVKGIYLDTPCTCTSCKSAEVPFVVFRPQNMPLSLDFSSNTAKIFMVDLEADVSEYSALAALPIEAIMLSNDDRLTWAALFQVKRFCSLGKPLIVQVPDSVLLPELQKLYKFGAAAFMVKGDSSDLYQEIISTKWQIAPDKKEPLIGTPFINCDNE